MFLLLNCYEPAKSLLESEIIIYICTHNFPMEGLFHAAGAGGGGMGGMQEENFH